MKQGFLLIDKPKTWTSFDVCNKMKRTFDIKRVGHTGTLDPFATGLLVVAIGKTTKLIPYLEKAHKTYLAEIWLGRTSETLDPESEITVTCEEIPVLDLEIIEKKIKDNFQKEIEQIPPKYSALKQNGKRLYQLAREGKEVIIKPRKTEIKSLKIISQEGYKLQVELTAHAGFYVRSFARDLSVFLGFEEGMCGELRRTAVGDLDISQAKLAESITPEDLLDPRQIINFPTIEIDPQRTEDFVHGRAFSAELPAGEFFFVASEQNLLGLAVRNERDWLQPKIKLIA